MITLQLDKFGKIISQREVGDEIFKEIEGLLRSSDKISIDFQNIRSMATFCAKQIFGKLYIKLTPQVFNERIVFSNASDDLQIIITEGINSALEESQPMAVTY